MQVNNEKTMLALKSASTEVEALVVSAQESVKAISDKYSSIVPDAETKDGYKFCKEVRAEVMPIKTDLEKVRKQLKEPVLSMGKLIDSNIKPLIESLDDVYKPFEAAYREVDNRKKRLEEERQAKIQAAFDAMNDAAMNAIGQTPIIIESIIDDVACTSFDKEVFQERQDEAISKHAELMGKLESMLTQAKAQEELEAKQREIEAREAAIRAEEERREREAAEAKRQQELAEAAEQARIKAKAEAQEREAALKLKAEQAAKQAEIDKQNAIQEAKEQEKARIEAEEKAKAEAQAALEANRAHVGKIRKQAKEDLINMGVSEVLAKDIVLAISKNQIRNLTINY